MKFYTLFLTLLFNIVVIYAKSSKVNASSFAVGSSTFCKANKLNKNNKLYYAAVSKELLKDKSLCNDYVVAMVADSQSKGKYKLVKALIRDECKECKANEIKLSNKAIKDINASKKANVIWAILSKEGKMKKGPIQPKLSEDEIIKMLKVFRVKKFDDLLERFTENAKYIAKRDKVRMKTLKGVKIEVIKKIANKKNKKVPVSKKITTAKKAAGGKKGKVIKTKVVKSVLTTKRVVVVTKARAATKVTPAKAKPTLSTINSTKNGKETSTGTLMTGAFAVSVAAGAALLFVRKRSAKKNYIFGEPLDKYDDKTAKELYARTKNGQKFKIQIPLNDFNDIAHIQIFSPRCKESNTDVYNVHTERAMMSDDNDSINTLPQPQEQPKPHAQLPIPANDFMMRFSLIEQPDLAALQKENIGAYDCTKITTRYNDDPYISQYQCDDNQEIYNSVPKVKNVNEVPTDDILLEYVEDEY